MVVPALDEDELGTIAERVLQTGAVARDRQSRVVRGEHEADDPLRAVGERSVDRLGNARPPVLHPDVDGQAELALEGRALRLVTSSSGERPPMRR